MLESQENYYKTCRKLAGFTQESASPLLGVEPRRLSEYENGAKVPDDVVDKMAEIYNAPMLAIWHIKMSSELTRKYLPDIYPTRTNSDLWMQTSIACKQSGLAEETIMTALCDGQLTFDDMPYIDAYIKHNDAATGNLMSAKAYISKAKNELSHSREAKRQNA